MDGYGHRVQAYHADNGRFIELTFCSDAKRQGQGLTYCHQVYGKRT